MSLEARRILALAGVLAAIWLALDAFSDGLFLSPRNLYNLSVQTSATAIMAVGMVLVIVARHIDLSVGSLLGFTGMAVAVLQAEWLPAFFGKEAATHWPLALAMGLGAGALIGVWQGYWVAYRGIPAFVITLAGLLMFRGAAFLLTDGRTVAPLDPSFQRLGGGLEGSIGSFWSTLLGVSASALLVLAVWRSRARRQRFGVAPRPIILDLAGVLGGVAALLGFVALTNAVPQPGGEGGRGLPIPVLVLGVVAALVGGLARRTRFGRYVFAMGGSPDAALRAGIDVRRVTLAVFALMGLLAAIAGALTTARLGAGTNSMGTLAELHVIAAAVIGGTSLSGGTGSIAGAVLGALVMQSLENGMVLLGVSSPLRQIAIGLILIGAVWWDVSRLRRREAPA